MMNRGIVSVEIFDTTLRDGAQSLPAENQFPDGSKPEIARQVAELGVSVIEAGFPATPGDDEEVKNVAATVGQETFSTRTWESGSEDDPIEYTPVIASLSRAVRGDIETAWKSVEPAKRPRIHTFISTDELHMAKKFPGKSPDEVLAMGRNALRLARDLTSDNPNASVEFSAEAASTTDMNYLERVIKMAVEEGVDVVNGPDTVGPRNPFWMKAFYSRVMGWALDINPDVTVSAHNHNDLDLAAANTWALMEAAAEAASMRESQINVQAETTICGIGERAGNTDIFPVLAHLFKYTPDMDVEFRWQINPEKSVAIAKKVLDFAHLEVDRQSPIVGKDTIVHRSGVHSDGVIKGGFALYTPHDPRFWGHEVSERHEDGKYQGQKGRAAIAALNCA